MSEQNYGKTNMNNNVIKTEKREILGNYTKKKSLLRTTKKRNKEKTKYYNIHI